MQDFKNSLLSDTTKEASKILLVTVNDLVSDKIPFKRDFLFTESSMNELEKLPNVKNAFYTPANSTGWINDPRDFSNKLFVFVEGSLKKFDENIPKKLLYGKNFTDEDYNLGHNVALIDEKSAIKLFGDISSTIGKEITVEISGKKIKTVIKGIIERLPGQLGDNVILKLPDKTFNSSDEQIRREIMIKLKDARKSKETIEIIKNYYFNKTKVKDLYRIDQLSEQIQEITSILDKISLFIAFIASISLIVGGIGVMNIMLVSVTERISEIGLRKAIGAKNKDILIQFLIEAIILTLTGGIIGVIFGYSISLIIGYFVDVVPILEQKALLSSLIISISIGIIFGIFPAKKASKLSPIEALRKE